MHKKQVKTAKLLIMIVQRSTVIIDTVKEQWSSTSRNAVWRNLLGDPAGEEERAHKVGTALGLNPQELMDNPDLMKQATLTYEGQRNRDFLQGRPFTPQTLSTLYPEVDPTDTVAASMALKDYNNLMDSRRTIDEYSLQAGNSLARAWQAGLRDYDASMLMGEAMNGTKSMDEAGRGIYAIGKEQEAYENTERGVFESIAGGTARNLANMYKSTLDGMKQLVGQLGPQTVPVLQQIRNLAMPLGASAGAAMGAAGIAGAGVPLAVGGAAAGLGVMALSTFLGSYKQQAAQNFWRMATKKNDNGTPMYTREEAIRRARTQAFYQAGLEMIGTEIAVFGPIAKVFGKETARQLIQNTAARNALLTAGRAALRKDTAKVFGKQFAKGASAELLEEGLQQAVSDVDERIFGNETMGGGQILWNAVDAMVQAAPAVIGMVLPGAAAGAARRYRSMAALTAPELHDAVEEYKRENEAAMTQKLLESREQSQVYVKDKDVYGSIIQKQMERAGQGTMYLDVSSAVETPEGQAAVNELIQKGVVTAKEVTDAVESHGALEIAPGTYMQEVTPEAAETLAQHASYDAGGRTLAEIKAARKRMQDMRDIISETREEREAKAVKDLLDRDFPQGGEKRAVMEEVLSDDIHDVKGSLNRAIQTTKDQLAALTGADEKIQYLQEKQKNGSQDVGLITYVGDSGQYESRRVSGNEGWYSEFYKNNKKAPTQRDAYEIAYRETMEEISHSDDPEAEEAGKEIEALHDKLETLEELTDYVGKLDQDDLITKSQMSEDAYKTIYTPAVRALSQGSPNVAKAAKDSALLYAKMADALHEAYQLPYEDIAKIQIGGRTGSGYSQYMSPEDQLAIDEKHFADMVDRFMNDTLDETAIRVMTTPLVMELVGADVLPIEISAGILQKILKEKHQKGMSPQIMKQIPRALSDPLFIANSYGNRKVVALDLKDETGAGVIVAIELGKSRDKYAVNDIKSIYGKTKKKTDTPDWEWLANQFTKYHTVEYVNKRKTINWIHNEKLETLMPYESNDGFFSSIKANEEDLVKLKQENPTYYQMAGVRAENAPMERLAEAKAMWEARKPEDEIFRKTGWIRKKDGKWRWEIPDNLDAIHLEKLSEGSSAYLGQIYDNPKLYEAYPFMWWIKVSTIESKGNFNGYTNIIRGERLSEIFIKKNWIKENPDGAKTTLVHEIQHAIQHYEGFAAGGNDGTVRKQMAAEADSAVRFIQLFPHAKEWLNARKTANELSLHALENPRLAKDAEMAQAEADELEKKIPKGYINALIDADAQREQINEILTHGNQKNFGLYMNLHGEIEARDSAARAERALKYDKDIKEAKKKVESAGKAMMEAISKLSGKERRNAEKWMTMEKALLKNQEKKLMYRPTDEEIDERIALEDALPESVQKEHDAWFQATWDYVGALQDKDRDIPDSMVHDPNAIVVFGSLYVPYSTGKTYYQSNAVYGGQYSETENVIRVFDGGNMSTVVHESAHFWLFTMERISN